MISFAARRIINASILVFASAAIAGLWALLAASLHRTSVLSGWSLFGIMVALSVYNVKKKLPFLPTGRSAHWLQFHVYAGLLTGVLFFIHVGIDALHGGLETALAALYGIVFVSGGAGVFIARTLPRRLSQLDEEVIYERIPSMRRRILAEGDELAVRAAAETNSPAVSDFYMQNLRAFFETPGSLRVLLAGSRRSRHQHLTEIDKRLRYMTAAEREFMGRLAELVHQKSDLDYHHAGQQLLKHWLFVHIPATYSLLIVALVHACVAYSFSGGSG